MLFSNSTFIKVRELNITLSVSEQTSGECEESSEKCRDRACVLPHSSKKAKLQKDEKLAPGSHALFAPSQGASSVSEGGGGGGEGAAVLRAPPALFLRAAMEAVRLLPLLLLLGLSVSSSAVWDLVLLHTNDVHARVEETDVNSGKCGVNGQCFAGVARRATEVSRIRSTENNVLLLDAGDQFQGTVWFNFYKGAEAAHFMNKLRYDATVRAPPVLPSSAVQVL